MRRRTLILGMIGLVAAPAVIRHADLMRIRVYPRLVLPATVDARLLSADALYQTMDMPSPDWRMVGSNEEDERMIAHLSKPRVWSQSELDHEAGVHARFLESFGPTAS
jgi:hypothetical protein